uniref:Serpentine Receptor, class U n=1 Tax=Caenorhabditis tropicalis TaxID=1561998 RepID=A0A1I7UW63_9PELO
MNNVSINGDERYINYKFNPFIIPVYAAAFPLIYLIPTVFIILKIIRVYIGVIIGKQKDTIMNPNVFTVIVFQLSSNFLYMLSDYSTIRLPSTGIMTSWCASQQPNHGLKILFFSSVYFNYTTMLFPTLLSALRLIPVYKPMKLEQLCSRLVRICIPLILIYPFFFTFPIFPALGDCRQLLGAYPFGSIYVYWSHSWFDLKLSGFLLCNLVFWLIVCTIMNIVLYRKLESLRNKNKSCKIRKAEISLTLTTISMLSAYITNLALVIVAIYWPFLAVYLVAIRPYGSDCDFVLVPWMFYLTHPIFKEKEIVPTQMRRIPTDNSDVP